MSESPAGWYQQDDDILRWWDGAQWTDHVAPTEGNVDPTPQAVDTLPQEPPPPNVGQARRLARGITAATPLAAVALVLYVLSSLITPFNLFHLDMWWYNLPYSWLFQNTSIASVLAFRLGWGALPLVVVAVIPWLIALAVAFVSIARRNKIAALISLAFLGLLLVIDTLHMLIALAQGDYRLTPWWWGEMLLHFALLGMAIVAVLLAPHYSSAYRRQEREDRVEIAAQMQEARAAQWRADKTAAWVNAYRMTNAGAEPPSHAIPDWGPAPLPPIAPLAIMSLAASLLCLQILGVAFGHIARSRIRRTGERGYGLATAGMVLGYASMAIGTILTVMIIVLVRR